MMMRSLSVVGSGEVEVKGMMDRKNIVFVRWAVCGVTVTVMMDGSKA